MRILSRYVLRAHVGPFVFALSALTLVMLLNELGQRFSHLVGKGLHWTVIAEVFALSLPFIIAMTLPMAVLVAVLYSFNRLAGDNEITAMQANGVPLPRLMLPVLLVSTLVAGGLVWFNNTVLPESNHELQVLLSSISRKKPSFALRERTINEVLDDELYLQAARIDRKTSDLEDVVIYDHRDPNRSRTIYADSGRMAFNESQTDLYLRLYSGTNQERKADEPGSFQRIRFREMVMRVPDVSNRLNREQMSRYRGDREMPISQMREEVRKADDRGEALRRESREFAVAFTRRLLGRPARMEAPGSTAPPAGDEAAAGARSGATGGAGDPRTAVRLAERSGAEGVPQGADGGREASGGGSGDSAARREAARRDSLMESAREEGQRAAAQVQSLASPAARMNTYHSRTRSAQRRANRFAVEIHKKWSIPAACIVFVLIGAPLAVRFRKYGVAMVVGLSLAFFCAYYVSLIGGEELADDLILSPFWSMWAPNVLFGAVGAVLTWREVQV